MTTSLNIRMAFSEFSEFINDLEFVLRWSVDTHSKGDWWDLALARCRGTPRVKYLHQGPRIHAYACEGSDVSSQLMMDSRQYKWLWKTPTLFKLQEQLPLLSTFSMTGQISILTLKILLMVLCVSCVHFRKECSNKHMLHHLSIFKHMLP